MILRINPNRMELLRLRRRLVLARRGHKLLQDKLEDMMHRLMALLKDVDAAKQEFEKATAKVTKELLYCRITSPGEEFAKAVSEIDVKIAVDFSLLHIMNIRVPVFNIKALSINKFYDFFNTSGQLDIALADAEYYIKISLRLGELLKTLNILSFEIERTRRRVNALEYILIPSIEDTIKYIV